MQVVLPDSDVQDLERGRNYNEIHPYCLFSPVLYHIPRHLIFWGGGESCIFTGGISLFSQLICLWSWIPCRNICIIETELGGLQCPEPGLGSKWAEEFRVLLQIPTNWTFASVINWHRAYCLETTPGTWHRVAGRGWGTRPLHPSHCLCWKEQLD